jgi:hypothetical protein
MVGKKWGKSSGFKPRIEFVGYTKVAQKCDGLAEMAGGTGVKIRFYRKTAFMGRVGPGVPQKFPKSSRFVRTGIENTVPVVGKGSVKVQCGGEWRLTRWLFVSVVTRYWKELFTTCIA